MLSRYSRRTVLAHAAALGAVILSDQIAAASSRRFFGCRGPLLGLQLYSLGDDAFKDLNGTFEKVAAIGYRSVELVAFAGHTPLEIRAALKRAGLVARSALFTFQAYGPNPNLSTNLEKIAIGANILGLEHIVSTVFVFPSRFGAPKPGEEFRRFIARVAAQMTRDDWIAYAELLNSTGAALNRHGLRVGHHNHNLEFTHVGETTGFDLLVTHTDPHLVDFELDVGWVAAAGLDPVSILARYPGRFRMMHIKDVKANMKPNFALEIESTEVGAGVLNWESILRAAKQEGVTGYYVEQEPPFTIPRFDAARSSYEFLERLEA